MLSKNDLTVISSLLRAMQISYHHLHHTSRGASFFSDHSAAKSFYEEVEGQFDSVTERLIGNNGVDALDIQVILSKVSKYLSGLTNDPMDNWRFSLSMEKSLQDLSSKLCERADEADKQLLGDIANISKGRSYQIKQRMKGE